MISQRINKLAQTINDLGITKYKIAKDLDLHQSTLKRIFDLEISPKLETIEMIEKYLQKEHYRTALISSNLNNIYELVWSEMEDLQIKRIYPNRSIRGDEDLSDYNGLSKDEEELFDVYSKVFDLLRTSNLLQIEGEEDID